MPPLGQNGKAQTGVLAGLASVWQPCTLTWYDPALGGTNSASGAADPHSKTASGEPYDPNAFTCAAPAKYPFGTVISFTYGGKAAIACRVNDRGGAIQGNHFDLSRGAADALGILGAGRVQGSFQVGSVAGATRSANQQISEGQANGGGGGGPTSILGLLTAPTDQIGGWLAQIVVNLAKDAVIGFADVVIIPAWHWNQRAVDRYQASMFSDPSGKQLLWTAAFWGGGYWLLFTDPDQRSLAPAPVRRSRLARHTRFAQALPARQSLVKPKDVKAKTPKKPKPVVSRAGVTQTGTMATTRTQRVRVTGTHAGTGTESTEPIEPTGALPTENGNSRGNKPTAPSTVPNARDRTGTRSLPDRGGTPQGVTRSRQGRGR